MRATLLLAALVLVGCGGPSLADLRCQSSCQDHANPFRLLLRVDFDDPDGELAGGRLLQFQDEVERGSLALDALIGGARVGTMDFGLELRIPTFQDGRKYMVGVRAQAGEVETNTPTMQFVLHI